VRNGVTGDNFRGCDRTAVQTGDLRSREYAARTEQSQVWLMVAREARKREKTRLALFTLACTALIVVVHQSRHCQQDVNAVSVSIEADEKNRLAVT
jgi:hypothetical protein